MVKSNSDTSTFYKQEKKSILSHLRLLSVACGTLVPHSVSRECIRDKAMAHVQASQDCRTLSNEEEMTESAPDLTLT